MAFARIVHTDLDGSTDEFDVTFPYISQTHVKVELNGTLTTDFTFISSSRIQMDSMPASGDDILIYRATSPSTRLVDYQSGSILSEEILDTDSLQAFYLAQEANDVATYVINRDSNNNWDATNNKIVNVSNPTTAQDAATKSYVDGVITTNAANVTAAQTAQTAAETAKTAAETAQTAAETALDSFTDIYLGAFATDPATDNDGDALTAGDQYFNTTSNVLKIYNGSSWQDAAVSGDAVVGKTSVTGSGQLPVGTTGQRDGSPSAGFIRFNSTDTVFEGYNGSEWGSIGGGGPGLDGGGIGEESVIRTNKNQISGSVSLTIPSGSNGMSAGPITITAGSSVTVSAGAAWHIVGT